MLCTSSSHLVDCSLTLLCNTGDWDIPGDCLCQLELVIPFNSCMSSRGASDHSPRNIWLDGAHLVLVKAAIVVLSIESGPSTRNPKSSPDQTVKPLQNPSNLIAASISRVNETHSARLKALTSIRSCPARYHRDPFICPAYPVLDLSVLPSRPRLASVLGSSLALSSVSHSFTTCDDRLGI